MMKVFKIFLLFLLFLLACQPQTGKKKPTVVIPAIKTPEITVVSATEENVRLSPNGKVIGQLLKGDTLRIMRRHANWLFIESEFFETGYIWAPSAGLDYINLNSPYTYYDSKAAEFYPISYFIQLFGSEGEKRSTGSGEKEIVFDEMGLGSHEEIVMEVVNEQVETIEHGISFFLREPDQQIVKIKIDFVKPIKGINKVIERCGLSALPPSTEDEGHVIWKSGTMIDGLELDLERKEWESEWFSALWLRLAVNRKDE